MNENFESLGLSQAILNSIHQVGFTKPTPIQAQVIPIALAGKDIIGLAQTGSGKTAAFCIPISERLLHGSGLRGLILCPTREIALQTKHFLDLFGKHHELDTVCIIGGVRMDPQIRDLKKNPDIIVATPGRLADHLNRGNVKLQQISELVLDEADHMLDLGFLPQIKEILGQLPQKRHTMMFSATMPDSIERLAQYFLQDPTRIDILPEGKTAQGIEHRLYLVKPDDKKACLLSLLHQEKGSTLVFSQTKMDTDWLCRVLEEEGQDVARIHSDRTQKERTHALQGFREGLHRILVATAIASRGIDVPDIQHVINFEIPDTVEEYIHRAGRTARADALGIVSTIATWTETLRVKEFEKTLGIELPRCTAPGIEPYVEIKVKPFGRNFRRTL